MQSQSPSIRPYILQTRSGIMEAHKRENVADMERSAQSHLIQLRHFAQTPALRPFFPLAFLLLDSTDFIN
jgi:hypothetical protein